MSFTRRASRSSLAITGSTARLPRISGPQRGAQLINHKGLAQRRPFEIERLVLRDSVAGSEDNPEFAADGRRASLRFYARPRATRARLRGWRRLDRVRPL